MSNLQAVYAKAVAKLGENDVNSMLYVCGATKPELSDVPPGRRNQLLAVLTRMTGSGAALAQARADFETVKAATRHADADDKAKPQAKLDPVAIFKKWNASKSEFA